MSVSRRLLAATVPASSWTPASLPSLALWLDADDASTFAYGTGTRVAQWNDKSGNARHFSQPTATARPDRNGTRNGRTSVTFTRASGHWMTAGDTLDLGTASLSIFVAGRMSGNAFEVFIAKAYYGAMGWRWWLGGIEDAATTATGYTRGNSPPDVTAVTTSRVTTWQTWGSVLNRSSGLAAIRRAKTQQASTSFTAESANGGNSHSLLLGAYNDSSSPAVNPFPSSFLDGEIGEVVVCQAALSGANLTNLEDYLQTKWGTP